MRIQATLTALLSAFTIGAYVQPAEASVQVELDQTLSMMAQRWDDSGRRVLHYCPYGQKTSLYLDPYRFRGRVHYPLTNRPAHVTPARPCPRLQDQYTRHEQETLTGTKYYYENKAVDGYCLPDLQPGDTVPELQPCITVRRQLIQDGINEQSRRDRARTPAEIAELIRRAKARHAQ